MEETRCPAVVVVGEPRVRATVKVRCAKPAHDRSILHTATLFGRERTWTRSTTEIREW